jgi:hypothetical protein
MIVDGIFIAISLLGLFVLCAIYEQLERIKLALKDVRNLCKNRRLHDS